MTSGDYWSTITKGIKNDSKFLSDCAARFNVNAFGGIGLFTPNQRERSQKGIYMGIKQYEFLKAKWIANNPGATPKQYTAAMLVISRKCGI